MGVSSRGSAFQGQEVRRSLAWRARFDSSNRLDEFLGEEIPLSRQFASPNRDGGVMRKLLLVASLFAVAAVLASPASAGTTNVSVSMSFTEPIIPAINSGCPVIADGFCGSGVVVPFGHATE